MAKKGDTVFYVARDGLGQIVRARVLTGHRHGGAKVEAHYYVEEGRPTGAFLGFKFELSAEQVHANALDADNYRSAAKAAQLETAAA